MPNGYSKCFFCGCKHTRLGKDNYNWFIFCCDCLARASYCENKQDAVKSWEDACLKFNKSEKEEADGE